MGIKLVEISVGGRKKKSAVYFCMWALSYRGAHLDNLMLTYKSILRFFSFDRLLKFQPIQSPLILSIILLNSRLCNSVVRNTTFIVVQARLLDIFSSHSVSLSLSPLKNKFPPMPLLKPDRIFYGLACEVYAGKKAQCTPVHEHFLTRKSKQSEL